MRHRIFTGTFEALEARLLDTIVERQKADALAPVAVLVGSNILAAYLKIRLAERGRPVANVRFYTFPDLIDSLSPRISPGRERPRLTPAAASIILRDVLEERAPAVFASVAGFAGFRAALLETFRDLRDAGITPDDFHKSLPAFKGLTPDRLEYLAGMSRIYLHFQARTAGFINSADDFRRAAASISRGRLEAGAIQIYGLYDVTGVQADLLRSLQSKFPLEYFIPYVNESASSFASRFVASRARELGVTPSALPEAGSLLRVFAGRIFAVPWTKTGEASDAPLRDDGAFALISVPGESRAAIEVVREICRAVRDKVIQGFYEAAVILRNPDEDVPILTEALRLRGIPYFVHGGSAFRSTPLARAVLAIAGLETESYARRAILTAMELVAAALPEMQAKEWGVSQWRALVNDARFLAGAASWDAGTEALVRAAGEELRRAEARETAGADEESEEGTHLPVSSARAKRRLDAAISLRNAWAALRRAAAGWPADSSWQDWARLLHDRLYFLLGQAEDWPTFAAALDEIDLLGTLPPGPNPSRGIARQRLLSSLSEVLDGFSCPEGRFQRRGVNLLPAAASRGLRFPLVIVPGLEEGRFPARLRQDPLLLDAERAQLGDSFPLPLKSLRGEEEVLLFDMAVRSAEKRLVLMTSRLDEASDRERIPSQFFLRAASAASGASVNLAALTPEDVPGLRSVSLDDPGPGKGQRAVDKGEIRLGLIAGSSSHARAAVAEISRLEPLLLQGPLAYDRARWNRRLTEFDGRILDPQLLPFVSRTLLTDTTQLSPSRIEEYAKCPYLFYLRRVQELEEWEEEENVDALDPLLRGQIVHGILESFLCEFNAERFAGTSLPRLQTALTDVAQRLLDEGRPPAMPDLIWEVERDRLLELLQGWLRFERKREDTTLLPRFLERSFGAFAGATELPACRIGVRDRSVEFRGRIDRIDLSPDGRRARIIDYKTGGLPDTMKPGKRTLLMAGEKIQLAVYRGALEGMPELAKLEQIEAEYLHLPPRGGDPDPCTYSVGELKAAQDRLPEILEIVCAGIESGVFFARPSGSVRPDGHCAYCDFLPICGKDRAARKAGKDGDPAIVNFTRLKEIDKTGEEDE